jgi:hypothetical protein
VSKATITAGKRKIDIRLLNDDRVNALKTNTNKNKISKFLTYAPVFSIVPGSIVKSPFSCICR